MTRDCPLNTKLVTNRLPTSYFYRLYKEVNSVHYTYILLKINYSFLI